MSAEVEVQFVVQAEGVPPLSAFHHWVEAATADLQTDVQLTIRIVDELESRTLNHRFRGRDKPTNVLSFPFEAPPGVPLEEIGNHLGDLVICAPVVRQEAGEQGKTQAEHWAHMVVHGVLHLRGFDHQADSDAEAMEQRERQLLAGLGFADPYATA